MAPVPDPYRTLGLARGATIEEVKRAYRRLAKEHHPDSGGERALPRFLEIQAAYEQLVGAPSRASGRASTPHSPQGPWQADDARSDATRRAYGSRSRRPGPSRRARPDAGARRGGAARDGQSQTGGRPPNKATFGSTSYDGAEEEPFEPGWTGASWYGTSSGTYWTLNPREYADPRKHGPEYQARARRRAEAEAATGGSIDPPPADASAEVDPEDEERSAPDPTPSDPPPDTAPSEPAPSGGTHLSGDTRSAGSWWTAPRAEPGERRSAFGRPDPPETAPALDPLGTASAFVRRLVADPPDGPRARVGLALAGGLPPALGLAWLLGELTGCGRFAATCDPTVVSLAWFAGIVILGALVLLPRLGAAMSVGTLALLAAGVPATVFLSASGGSRTPEASGAILGTVLAVAWIAGSLSALLRRRRLAVRGGPVS